MSARAAEGDPPGTRGLDELRVLVVDDHDLFRTGLRNLLEEEGVNVVGEAENGENAIRLTSDLAPDVVIMDLNMPGLSGLEVARRARLIPYQRPMIVMSGRVTDADLERLRQLGIARVLYKPFTADVLRSALRAIFPPAAS